MLSFMLSCSALYRTHDPAISQPSEDGVMVMLGELLSVMVFDIAIKFPAGSQGDHMHHVAKLVRHGLCTGLLVDLQHLGLELEALSAKNFKRSKGTVCLFSDSSVDCAKRSVVFPSPYDCFSLLVLSDMECADVPLLTPSSKEMMSQALKATFSGFAKEQQRLGIPKGKRWQCSCAGHRGQIPHHDATATHGAHPVVLPCFLAVKAGRIQTYRQNLSVPLADCTHPTDCACLSC